MDGSGRSTQCPILPGTSFQYRFKAEQPGTFWYHAHVPLQYGDGLIGALIVHDPEDPFASEYDEERELIITGEMITS